MIPDFLSYHGDRQSPDEDNASYVSEKANSKEALRR